MGTPSKSTFMAAASMATSKMAVTVLTVTTLVGLSLSVPQRSVSSDSQSCTTLTGDLCVFPFRHQGEEHQACTFSGSELPWCATSIHSNGTLVLNKWGECRLHSSSTCRVEAAEKRCLTDSGPRPGIPCIFPFSYSGKVYNQCAEWVHGGENEGKFWCSTKVDNFDRHINGQGQYGFCSPTCFEQKDEHPPLLVKVEDDKSLEEENGAVLFYDEIPLILEDPK